MKFPTKCVDQLKAIDIKIESIKKEEWERISASIYGFATTELNLKRPLK